MTAQEYHSDPLPIPSLSASIAHTLISRSPSHAWLEHPKLGGKSKLATKEMDFGTVCHELMLNEGRGFVILDFKDYKKDAAQVARDAAIEAGKTPILTHAHELACKAVHAWRAKLNKLGYQHVFNPEVGTCEHFIQWDEDGVLCRSLLDFNAPRNGALEIWDLKTTTRADDDSCLNKVKREGLPMKSEFYKRGAEKNIPALVGRVKHGFVFAECSPPFEINVFDELDAQFRHVGQKQVARAIELWRHCTKENDWPGYAREGRIMECPAWYFKEELLQENDE